MQIVNVRGMKPNAAGIVYCGRAFAGWESSILANPIHFSECSSRFECIDRFRTRLWMLIQKRIPLLDKDNPATTRDNVIKAILALKEDSVLGCWCKPLDCHCDVIVSAWHYLKEGHSHEQTV